MRSDSLRQTSSEMDTYFNTRRQIHEKYSVPRINFREWVLRRVQWCGGEQVLDLGCGPGHYAVALRQVAPDTTYYGVDFSRGMLDQHKDAQRLAQADVQRLPFPDHTFDVVMANHILYHVTNIDHTLDEIQRVLKPGGSLAVATNSINTMPQFYELYKRAIMVLMPPGKQMTVPLPASHAFSLESGTRRLARQFFAVVRYDFPSAFVFQEIDPVMTYLESSRHFREPQLPAGVSWDAVMLIMREQIKNQLAYAGELIVHKLSGVLIASDSDGFYSDCGETQNGSR